MNRANKLVTIPFSHYSERARWALEHCKIPFVEKTYFPVFHMIGTILEGGFNAAKPMDRHSTKFSVPLFIPAESEGIRCSGKIVEWANSHRSPDVASLYPEDQEEKKKMKEQEDHWSDYLGPHVRRVAYSHVMPDINLFEQLCKNNMDPNAWQMTFFNWIGPNLMGRFISKGTQLEDTEKVRKSYEYLCKEFDSAAEYFKDEIKKLKSVTGSDADPSRAPKVTAASLTFAALIAPILAVQPSEGCPYWMPPIKDLPAGMQDLVRRFRAHPAGQLVLYMYKLR